MVGQLGDRMHVVHIARDVRSRGDRNVFDLVLTQKPLDVARQQLPRYSASQSSQTRRRTDRPGDGVDERIDGIVPQHVVINVSIRARVKNAWSSSLYSSSDEI
jgi:hypothetical protein